MSSSEGSITSARPATPPPRGPTTPVRITPAPALPREVVEARAVEAVATVTPPPLPRFPRADAALLALTLADRCRCAATLLDAAAASAPDMDPATLRRHVSAVVRVLVRELEGLVVL